jgi:hypothetical protein
MEQRDLVIPWWLAGGTERCPVCLQLYAYEVQVRCVDCDGPLCPCCAVEVRLDAVARRCPGCGDEPEATLLAVEA